jgi:hypothetical protein
MAHTNRQVPLLLCLIAAGGCGSNGAVEAPVLADGSIPEVAATVDGAPDATPLGFDAPPPPDDDAAPSGCKAEGDCDGDGFPATVDCDDRDATINPAAYDFRGDGKDNDCNGVVDDPVEDCAAAGTSATDHARALDLCAQRSSVAGKVFDPLIEASWGSVTAPGTSFDVGSDGRSHRGPATVTLARDPRATQVAPRFGDNRARAGGSLVVLSTGPIGDADPRGDAISARNPRWMTKADGRFAYVDDGCAALRLKGKSAADPGDCAGLSGGTTVDGQPIPVTDLAELRLKIRVPTNAQALAFDFAFFSTEFSEYWATDYNDAFFAIANGKRIAGRNVAKDEKGRPLTVNSGFFQLCPRAPGPRGIAKPTALANCVGSSGAPKANPPVLGTLSGTAYDGNALGLIDGVVESFQNGRRYVYGGGSGWLTAKFGVEPGEVLDLRLLIVDTADGLIDSAVAIDHIRWEQAPPKIVEGIIDRPPT